MQADTTTLAPTDAEIDSLVKATYGEMRGGPLQAHRSFARAIEAEVRKDYDALIRDAIDRVEPAPQPAAPQGDGDMLRAHAEGRVTHINNGLCPDIIEGHDTRDPECPVCQALLENHAALPAPPQGAAKGAT